MDEFYESLILKYLSGTASPEQLQQLEQWLSLAPENKELLKEYEATWSLGATPAAADFDTTAELSKLLNAIDRDASSNPADQPGRTSWMNVYKIAATFVLIALCSFILYRVFTKTEMIIRESGFETIAFSLPDGSKITLNRNSRLSYADDFNSERHLQLEGEAFFDVVRDPEKPFVIQAAKSRVEVLGTSFGFRAYESDSLDEVMVVTGKVSLSDDGNNVIILTKGQHGFHDKALHVVKSELHANPNQLAWQSKRLVFEKTQLREVAVALESYFDISIEIKNPELMQCRFTGSFEHPTVDEVLESLSIALNLNVTHQNKEYTFDGDRCTP